MKKSTEQRTRFPLPASGVLFKSGGKFGGGGKSDLKGHFQGVIPDQSHFHRFYFFPFPSCTQEEDIGRARLPFNFVPRSVLCFSCNTLMSARGKREPFSRELFFPLCFAVCGGGEEK